MIHYMLYIVFAFTICLIFYLIYLAFDYKKSARINTYGQNSPANNPQINNLQINNPHIIQPSAPRSIETLTSH